MHRLFHLIGFYHSGKLQSTKTICTSSIIHYLFYHSEKLQSTKTVNRVADDNVLFYHSEKFQSTKTWIRINHNHCSFYHSEKFQSTKTFCVFGTIPSLFYHSEKLQSTKTSTTKLSTFVNFRYNRTTNKKSTDHKTCAQNSTQNTLVICTTNSIDIYYC